MKKGFNISDLLLTLGFAAMLPAFFGMFPTNIFDTTTLSLLAGSVVATIFLLTKGYASMASVTLSATAGIIFQTVGGIFGTMKYNYYNPVWVILLFGATVVVAILTKIGLHGLASCVATAAPGITFCAFFIGFGKRAAYWHVADVFMKIDEQAFDPYYLLFCGLMVAAFIIGEVAIYLRKPGQPKKA